MGLGELQFEFGENVDGSNDWLGMRSDALGHLDEDAVNLRQFFFEKTHEFVVLFNGFQRFDENRLAAGTGTVNHSLHSALLFDLHRNDETLAANGDQLVLHGAAFGEAPQITAERFLNRAALPFRVATDAGEFGRGFIFERSIRLDLVTEVAKEFREVDDLGREAVNLAPIRSHCRRRILGYLAPFCGAIDDSDDVSDLQRFQRGSGDTGFCRERSHVQESRKIEAPADAAEFANLGGECLLRFDPAPVGRRSQRRDSVLSEWRRSEPAQERAQGIKLQDAGGGMKKVRGHQELWYRTERRPGLHLSSLAVESKGGIQACGRDSSTRSRMRSCSLRMADSDPGFP